MKYSTNFLVGDGAECFKLENLEAFPQAKIFRLLFFRAISRHFFFSGSEIAITVSLSSTKQSAAHVSEGILFLPSQVVKIVDK